MVSLSRAESQCGYGHTDGRFTLQVILCSDCSSGIAGVHEDNVLSTAELRSDLAPQMPLSTAVVHERVGLERP